MSPEFRRFHSTVIVLLALGRVDLVIDMVMKGLTLVALLNIETGVNVQPRVYP